MSWQSFQRSPPSSAMRFGVVRVVAAKLVTMSGQTALTVFRIAVATFVPAATW